MDVPLNERPPTIGQTMVRQRPMTSGALSSGPINRPTSNYDRPRTAGAVQRQQTPPQSSSQSGPMAQVQVGNHIQNIINNPNNGSNGRYQQPGMGGVLNQFGSGLCGMCTSVGGCFNGLAGSAFGNFTNLTSGISSYLPNLSMIQFRLLNLLSPSYSSEATNPFEKYNDLLIMKSNTSTVQYYSRDSIENLKIKVTIKRTNMVIGKKSFKERKEQRDNTEPYDDDEEETEYKTFVTVLQWQQKVFGPREMVLYNKTQAPKTTLEGFYKEEVTQLVESLNKEQPPMELYPYIQDDMENTVVEEMLGGSKKQPEKEDEGQEENEGEPKPKKERKPRKRFGSEGFSDLLQHKLFTYVEIDDFETDNVHKSIACSSETPYPIFKSANKPLSSKSQTMYIMTSVGEMQNGAWKGKEYPICIIQSLPDGSFLMKPGFSVKPLENQKEEPTSEFLKRYQNEIGDIDLLLKPKENRYIFRTDDGAVYEYTISLYNDYKKDTKVDEMRKKILKQLQERSLLMKRNLVGMEFNHPPKDKRIRVSISGNIISGRDFDSEKYYIRYYLDMPSNFAFEDPMSQKLVTSTQMATAIEITEEYESYYEANFSFPFNFNCLCSGIAPMPKLFFQVTSKDFWDRYRVEGYGFVSLPSTPGYHNYTVNTWKPTGSIRNNLRSSFVGGSTELRDLSYAAIPNGFEQHFLNKFGFATDPSGSISLCLNVIYHGEGN